MAHGPVRKGMPWASLLLGEASAGDMSLVFPERCCWGLTRPNRAPRPVRLLHPQLLHQGSLGAESRTVLARAWPSPLFPRAPLPLQKPVPWAKELGRVTAMEVLPAAQEEAQCWETGLREPWGGRAGSAGGGASHLCRVHEEGPKGRLPVLRLSRLSGQLQQDWK